MDLFSGSPARYQPPPPNAPRRWMLHHLLTAKEQVDWERLRKAPQPHNVVKTAIGTAWGRRKKSIMESGPWGYAAGRSGPPLRFEWAWSHREFFGDGRKDISGDAVIEAAAGVMGIQIVQDAGQQDEGQQDSSVSITPPSKPRPISFLSAPPANKQWRRPPMSVRARYQEGASPLQWPALPPRNPSPSTTPESEKVGFLVMMRRSLKHGDIDGGTVT